MKLSRQSLIGIVVIAVFITLIVMMVILTATEYSSNDLHYRINVNTPPDNSTYNSTQIAATATAKSYKPTPADQS